MKEISNANCNVCRWCKKINKKDEFPVTCAPPSYSSMDAYIMVPKIIENEPCSRFVFSKMKAEALDKETR